METVYTHEFHKEDIVEFKSGTKTYQGMITGIQCYEFYNVKKDKDEYEINYQIKCKDNDDNTFYKIVPEMNITKFISSKNMRTKRKGV